LQNRAAPLSNRAIGGLYPPGSTYKVVTGIAAMREGYITSDSLLECPASMNIVGTKFNNWFDEPLGAMNITNALEVSCDTFFYRLALDFYNAPGSPLQSWSRKFGLGSPTGVDVPGEEAGLIPDPAWRRKTFDGWDSEWSTGHSVNLSIGQGDLLVTPLQMTRIYAAIANGGTLVSPRVAQSIQDPGGKEVLQIPRGETEKIPMTASQLEAVRKGLYLAANSANGTSSAIFSGFEVPVAGKTGTAEKPPHGDMAWYCGYAPAAHPTIVACSIVESGGHGGTSAAPVVLRMFQQWFHKDGGNVRAAKKSD
jgi:penicillin-binding protein 2